MSPRPSSSFASFHLPSRRGKSSPLLPLIGVPFVALTFLCSTELALGDQQIIALSGDVQAGGSNAVLAGVSAPTLNASGQVLFQARLLEGVAGVGSHNEMALWLIDGGVRRLLARKGAGDLAEGSSFAAFNVASVADDGDVTFRGTTDDGKQGLWRVSANGSMSTIAITATTGSVPGQQLQNAQFDTLGFSLMHSASDILVFNGRLKRSVGGIDTSSSRGTWRDDNGVKETLLREGSSTIPGTGDAKLLAPSAEGVNAAGQMVLLGSMVPHSGDTTAENALALWRAGGAAGDSLVARTGSGNVAGVAGASFLALSDTRINSAGKLAYAGVLSSQGAITSLNDRGIWTYDGAASQLVARTGDAAPGVPQSEFESLGAPVLSDSGQTLFTGAMRSGIGGVTPATSRGIWTSQDGNGVLIARSGLAGAPGAPAAKFAEFGALASNDDGLAAFTATLESGAGGVADGNNQGLWLMDAAGDGRLIARTGDVIAGRTIASLEFTGGSGGGDGRQRALNDHGQLAYKVAFTNGDEAALLYTPDLSWRSQTGGQWDAAANWTLGILPSSVHRVDLVGVLPTNVVGPSGNVTIRELTLGGGAGQTTLELPESSILTVTEGVHLAANGRLAGKGTLAGHVISAGATSPGLSTGILAIDGGYVQQQGGTLAIEIGGIDNSSPLQTQFDQLIIFGTATLGGALDVSLVNGFVPAVGDTFPIVKATGGLTSFDEMNLPTLPSDREWSATWSVDTLALTVVATAPASPADFNHDGDVDAADLAQWEAGFGSASPGDVDGSGTVDGADFLAWQRAYTGGNVDNKNVPEPATAMLAAVALASIVGRPRRRRAEVR